MKRGPSLQAEKEALLEHIHASRAAYRRMLTDLNTAEQQKFENKVARLAPEQPGFPRSMTVRWVMKHPYLSALAVAGTTALIAIGPRRAAKAIGSRTKVIGSRAAALKRSTVARGGPVLGLLTAMATAIWRNPSKVQLALRAFSSVGQYVRRRRQRHH